MARTALESQTDAGLTWPGFLAEALSAIQVELVAVILSSSDPT
tara:strand:- start:990 stop:1118 length:129 start_codon:yes stop_codon:yes gene_type:complete